MSCCHCLSRSIQSSNVEMRAAMEELTVLSCDGFLTIRVNTVILFPMDTAVNLQNRLVTRPNSFIFTLFGDLVHRAERRFLALDRIAHPADGTLWDFGSCRAAGRVAHFAAGLARCAPSGQPRFLFGYRPWTTANRRAEPADLRSGHRLGRPLAHDDLCGGRDAPRGARPLAQGADRTRLGAALVLNLDFSGGYARGRAAGRRRPTASAMRSTPLTARTAGR